LEFRGQVQAGVHTSDRRRLVLDTGLPPVVQVDAVPNWPADLSGVGSAAGVATSHSVVVVRWRARSTVSANWEISALRASLTEAISSPSVALT